MDCAMTDLEMKKLCAEAMGLRVKISQDRMYSAGSGLFIEIISERDPGNGGEYDPLRDDAQAMALDGWLLERGSITFYKDMFYFRWDKNDNENFRLIADMTKAENRRRARVECVAQLWALKKGKK
jgi:hypothetical protein